MVNQQHKPIIKSPFYADESDGTMLHRFLDDDFVARFLQRAQDADLQGTRYQSWREEDRFGVAAQDHVNLRLAVHRTFYMVSAQVHCQAFAEPAFDPARILEAGMVVRKGSAENFHTWQIQQQAAQGWMKAKIIDQEPDQYKHLVRSGLIKAKPLAPLYSGEKTHPMYAQLIKTESEEGATQRSQCLIYGYLPLSGSVEVNQSNPALQLAANPMSIMAKAPENNFQKNFQNSAVKVERQSLQSRWFSNKGKQSRPSQRLTENTFDKQNEETATQGAAHKNNPRNSPLLGLHEWPFGSWDGHSQGPCCDCEGSFNDLSEHPCQQYQWQDQTGLVCDNHKANTALIGLLRTLIESFHIHQIDNKSNSMANQAIRNLLGNIYFYHSAYVDDSGEVILARRSETLLSYIQDHKDQLIQWFALLDQHANNPAINRAQSELGNLIVNLIPSSASALYIDERQAAQLRRLLVLRNQVARKESVDALPIAKFSQGRNDLYFVKPFIRYLDHCGKEQICWGPESKPFRVAAPMDPEAVRPTAIQLPELSDIKRGIAKGVSFMTPKSLADAIERVSDDLEFKESDKRNRFSQCLGYTLSFSIPVITICAMILLMIIMKLLNIFMRWIPWAMQKILRCP
jgi:hypothetical protein